MIESPTSGDVRAKWRKTKCPPKFLPRLSFRPPQLAEPGPALCVFIRQGFLADISPGRPPLKYTRTHTRLSSSTRCCLCKKSHGSKSTRERRKKKERTCDRSKADWKRKDLRTLQSSHISLSVLLQLLPATHNSIGEICQISNLCTSSRELSWASSCRLSSWQQQCDCCFRSVVK